MSRYAETFKNPSGAGDARPTAMQIVEDEGLVGNLKDKVKPISNRLRCLVPGQANLANSGVLDDGRFRWNRH
jgi:hypothetical protein